MNDFKKTFLHLLFNLQIENEQNIKQKLVVAFQLFAGLKYISYV